MWLGRLGHVFRIMLNNTHSSWWFEALPLEVPCSSASNWLEASEGTSS